MRWYSSIIELKNARRNIEIGEKINFVVSCSLAAVFVLTCKFAKVCGVTVPDLLGVLRPHC